MKKLYLIQAVSALLLTTSYGYSEVNQIPITEDLNIKKPSIPVKHRVALSGLSMRGGKSVSAGAKIFIFDDKVRFNTDSYEDIHLQAGSFEGKGIINADSIKIVADQFSFTGTLKYRKSCTIVTPVAINPNSFSCQGQTAPTFIVDPTLPKITHGYAFAHFEEEGEVSLNAKDPRTA